MSCLLPQFKCLPDTFPLSFKTHQQSSPQLLKGRDPIQLRTLCVLSTTSPTTSTAATTVLDIEKLQLPSIEVLSNSVAGDRWKPPSITATSTVAPESPWIYDGGVGLSTEANTKAALATENLLASEAVIADAAAEAIALAKAALKVARDAVTLVGHDTSKKSDNALTGTLSTAGTTLPERARQVQPGKLGQVSTVGEQRESDVRWSESELSGNLLTDSEDLEPTQEELELLQSQLLNGIAVRSKRQNERKAKRERAAERAASTVVSVKSGSSGRKKKRSSLKDVDYADPLHYLRGTTSNFRLLSASEEQKLSEGIQDLIKLERLQEELAERCGGEPSFSQWASAAGVDQKTLRKRLDHGLLCKDKMIKSNIRLVISIAKTYKGTGMTLQDLVQEGCRGLVKGAEKFDAEKGFKFSTYAHWWIKQAVRKSLSEQSRTIRLPFHIVEASFRVKEARKRLYTENGKDPDDEEIAEATGLTMKRLEAVYLAPTTPISLDQKTGINEDLNPYDVISDPLADTPETTMTKQFMRRDLQKALDSLNSRERQVIHWRFGMDNGRMKTLQEIGELMGVTRERIRQIESSAFRKLKSKKRTKLLQQYAAVCRVQN